MLFSLQAKSSLVLWMLCGLFVAATVNTAYAGERHPRQHKNSKYALGVVTGVAVGALVADHAHKRHKHKRHKHHRDHHHRGHRHGHGHGHHHGHRAHYGHKHHKRRYKKQVIYKAPKHRYHYRKQHVYHHGHRVKRYGYYESRH